MTWASQLLQLCTASVLRASYAGGLLLFLLGTKSFRPQRSGGPFQQQVLPSPHPGAS